MNLRKRTAAITASIAVATVAGAAPAIASPDDTPPSVTRTITTRVNGVTHTITRFRGGFVETFSSTECAHGACTDATSTTVTRADGSVYQVTLCTYLIASDETSRRCQHFRDVSSK